MNSTETPTKARFRHRLYVVLPLFLVLGWVGVAGRSAASVTMPSSYVQSGAIVVGKALVTLEQNGFVLRGWNGAFSVDAPREGVLTVAALTTPVLIQRDGDSWLVPARMQLSVSAAAASPADISDWLRQRRPLPLPAHYLRTMLPLAESALADAHLELPESPDDLLPPLAGSALMFDVSRNEAETRFRAMRLAELAEALSQDDMTAFDMLIRDADTRDVLDAASSEDLTSLLSLSIERKRDAQLLPSVLLHPDITAILRLHPLVRGRVWLTSEASDDRDLLLLTQTILPLSDRSESSVSSVAVQAWEDGWKALQVDAETLNALMPVITADITALDAAGYPVRARAYAAGFVSGTHPLPEGLTDSTVAAFEDLRSIYDIVLAIVDPVVDEVSSVAPTASFSSAPSATDTPVIIPESDVRSMLAAHGCMFTTQSALRMSENGIYSVINVVLGTPAGDRIISFTFNPANGQVSGIEKNGQILPYSLTLEKYLEWVRGQ